MSVSLWAPILRLASHISRLKCVPAPIAHAQRRGHDAAPCHMHMHAVSVQYQEPLSDVRCRCRIQMASYLVRAPSSHGATSHSITTPQYHVAIGLWGYGTMGSRAGEPSTMNAAVAADADADASAGRVPAASSSTCVYVTQYSYSWQGTAIYSWLIQRTCRTGIQTEDSAPPTYLPRYRTHLAIESHDQYSVPGARHSVLGARCLVQSCRHRESPRLEHRSSKFQTR